MKLNDQYTLNVCRDELWKAIIDPHILQQCIPSCQNITMTENHHYSADIIVKFGFIKFPFAVELSIENIIESHSYEINANVISGPAKDTSTHSSILLVPLSDSATEINYQADVTLNSKLNKISDAIIKLSAKKWLDNFFAHLEKAINNGLFIDNDH